MDIDARRIEVLDAVTVRALRALSPAQKWELANQMVIEARDSIRCIVRTAHPEWPEAQVHAKVSRRMGQRVTRV